MAVTKEKQVAIDSALAKLTEEDKKVLGLIKKPKKKRVKKSYRMTVNYMIGDANGYTDMQETIKANNPFLPLVTSALDKMKVCEGSWGIQLNDEDYNGNFAAKNISKLEYYLLSLVSGYECDEDDINDFFEVSDFENNEENIDFLNEFSGLFIDETAYSFLVYEGYKLK